MLGVNRLSSPGNLTTVYFSYTKWEVDKGSRGLSSLHTPFSPWISLLCCLPSYGLNLYSWFSLLPPLPLCVSSKGWGPPDLGPQYSSLASPSVSLPKPASLNGLPWPCFLSCSLTPSLCLISLFPSQPSSLSEMVYHLIYSPCLPPECKLHPQGQELPLSCSLLQQTMPTRYIIGTR